MRPLVADTETSIGREIRQAEQPREIIDDVEHRAVLALVAAGGIGEADTVALAEPIAAIVALDFEAQAVVERVAEIGEPGRAAAGLQVGVGGDAHGADEMLALHEVHAGAGADVQAAERLSRGNPR